MSFMGYNLSVILYHYYLILKLDNRTTIVKIMTATILTVSLSMLQKILTKIIYFGHDVFCNRDLYVGSKIWSRSTARPCWPCLSYATPLLLLLNAASLGAFFWFQLYSSVGEITTWRSDGIQIVFNATYIVSTCG